jgi:hypothetical protein
MALERAPKVFPVARRSRSALWFTVAVAGLPLLLGLIVAPFTVVRPEKVWLEVGQAGLRITGSVNGQSIAHAETTFARRLTGDDTPGYWPKLRSPDSGHGGSSLPRWTEWSLEWNLHTTSHWALPARPVKAQSAGR